MSKNAYECCKEGCEKTGMACFFLDTLPGELPDEYYCEDHIEDAGYCSGCGTFCAGIESFDIGPLHGFCDNCADEIRSSDEDYFYDPDGFDFSYWAGDVPDPFDELTIEEVEAVTDCN